MKSLFDKAVDHRARKFRGVRRCGQKLFLACLLSAFFCPPLFANNPDNDSDQPKIQRGSVQWQINQDLSKRRQELYRKRLAVPGADSPIVRRDATVVLISGKSSVSSPAILRTNPLTLVFFTGMVLLAGTLFARRFRHQPLEDGPDCATSDEEMLLDEFVDSFRANVAATATDAQPIERDAHRLFCSETKSRVVRMRKLLDELRGESGDSVPKNALANLCSEFDALKTGAHLPETRPVHQLATAAEGLLKQLLRRPESLTHSTVRTMGGSLETLEKLCAPELKPDWLTAQPLKFLVVDDDLITRQALSLALVKAFGEPDLAEEGQTALARAMEQPYDVIFLDVRMPGMDGFELCAKIRGSERNRATPIIFVTSHNDFDARAQSTLSGGNDLMGKPFLIFEIALKALTHAFQARLEFGQPA